MQSPFAVLSNVILGTECILGLVAGHQLVGTFVANFCVLLSAREESPPRRWDHSKRIHGLGCKPVMEKEYSIFLRVPPYPFII